MLRFDWSAFVTPAVLSAVADAAAVPDVSAHAARMAAIIGHVGGAPWVDVEPTPDECSARGLALLMEALSHTLAEAGVRAPPDARASTPGDSHAQHLWQAVPRFDANSASAQQWAQLPGINLAVATAIVAERERAGRFANLHELVRRVIGLGDVRGERLAHALSFYTAASDRNAALPRQASFATQLRHLMRMQGVSDDAGALAAALAAILTSVATRPHPASRDALQRVSAAPAPATPLAAEWVGELWGSDYWTALPSLIDGATASLVVCMFHITSPSVTHPTYRLLQALVRAHQRGVAVRVLVDRDGKNDPYRSTLINSAAKKFLIDAGVACRSDSSARLLHSKYLVIDSSLVVLGSHNWSAGSYFNFDDLTLALSSAPLAGELLARFDAQWATAE